MTAAGLAARRALGALVLVALAAPLAAQAPVYVRRLGLPVADDTISYPRGVSADLHTGEVFVCDTRGDRILIFDAEGLFLYTINGGDVFSAPLDVAVDPEGYLLVVAYRERHLALVELDFDGLFRGELRLSGLPAGAVEPAVTSVAFSPTGDRLYAVDEANLSLWIADRQGRVTTPIDLAAGRSEKERADLILGHVDVYGDAVLLALPLDAEIRILGLDGSVRARLGKRGTAPCTTAFPVAAALAENGELVIVDQQRMLVLRWNVEANRCLGEYVGLGNAPGYLYYPMDLALDRSGQLFVSQGFEGRVQMYSGMAPAAPLKRPTP